MSCTSLNGFSVNIIGDHITHFKNGEYNYYCLSHLSEYKIRLTNNRPTLCDASIKIDGDYVGTWRIQPFNSIVIERPANVNRKFIFIAEESLTSQNTSINRSNDNGLISVTFKPEKNNNYVIKSNKYKKYEFDSNSFDQLYFVPQSYDNKLNTGVTVLGGGTDQYFNSVDPLTNIDNNNITTIHLRLVVSKDKDYISIKQAINTTKISSRIDVHELFY